MISETLTRVVRFTATDEPCTIYAVCDAENEMKKHGYEPEILRMHPADKNNLTMQITKEHRHLLIEYNDVTTWAGITLRDDASLPPGGWILETATEASVRAIE